MPFPALWVSMTNTRSTRKRKDSNFFKQLVLRSRDPFTTSRSYRWLEIVNTKVVKAGGNELETLANGIWNWNAIDSVAVHLKVLTSRLNRCANWLGCQSELSPLLGEPRPSYRLW